MLYSFLALKWPKNILFISISMPLLYLCNILSSHKLCGFQVQHAHVTDTAIADTASVELIVKVLNWCFPSFDYRWTSIVLNIKLLLSVFFK